MARMDFDTDTDTGFTVNTGPDIISRVMRSVILMAMFATALYPFQDWFIRTAPIVISKVAFSVGPALNRLDAEFPALARMANGVPTVDALIPLTRASFGVSDPDDRGPSPFLRAPVRAEPGPSLVQRANFKPRDPSSR